MVKCLMNNFVCVLSSDYSMDYILLHVLHCILSNDSRVGKSDEGLMSAFKVFILHAGHCDSSSFFPLKKHAVKQFKQNLCSHLTLLLAFPISVLLTSSNFTSGGISSDFIWEERKLKKLWIQAECLTSVFWSAFLSSLYFKHSFAQTFFSMLSPVVEWWCALVLCLLMVVDMTE